MTPKRPRPAATSRDQSKRPTSKPERTPRPSTGKPAAQARPSKTDHGDGAQRPRSPKQPKAPIWKPGPNARTVGAAETGMDLGHYIVVLSNNRLSVRAARKAVETGCCRINGKVESFGSRKLERGDIVEVILPNEDPEHRFDARRVLHDDVHLLAYDKPPFLAVTPQDGPKSWSLLDILKAAVGELFPVHRLDADTSGVVLFAKDKATATRLETYFAEHTVEKAYVAVLRGHIRDEGMHKSYLVKVRAQKGQEVWRSGRGQDAREAITTWTVRERLGPYASLVDVLPKTGRYHQIRIHFGELGHALYGDRLYGDRLDPVHAHRHMLHAAKVTLPNPGSGPALRIEAPMPRDMLDLIRTLRG